MGAQRKQTINIFYDGKRRKLRGVTKYTTCDDIIKMVIQTAAETKIDSAAFGVFECVNGVERLLSWKDNVLKVLRSWGSDGSKVELLVRRLGDVRSKMGKINGKKKRLTRLRSELFDADCDHNEAFIDMDDSNSFTYSNSSREYLVTDDNVPRRHKHHICDAKRQNDVDVKRSVFRRFFSSILKKKSVRMNFCEKNKMQKDNSNGHIHLNTEITDSVHAIKQDIPEARIQLCGDEFNELDDDFMGDNDCLDMETIGDSVLNQCIIDNLNVDFEDDFVDTNESTGEFKYFGDLEKNVLVDNCNSMMVEETFIKLDKIKQLFDSNRTVYKSEDEFMDSFMRTKFYDSESDVDA